MYEFKILNFLDFFLNKKIHMIIDYFVFRYDKFEVLGEKNRPNHGKTVPAIDID